MPDTSPQPTQPLTGNQQKRMIDILRYLHQTPSAADKLPNKINEQVEQLADELNLRGPYGS